MRRTRPRDVFLYLWVWCLGLERLVQGLVFLGRDVVFLIWQRRTLRRHIAELIERDGACTGEPRAS